MYFFYYVYIVILLFFFFVFLETFLMFLFFYFPCRKCQTKVTTYELDFGNKVNRGIEFFFFFVFLETFLTFLFLFFFLGFGWLRSEYLDLVSFAPKCCKTDFFLIETLINVSFKFFL